jgi:feruloyl esterase
MGLGEGKLANVVDSKHDVLSAVVEWVENKIAPDQIVATAWTDDKAPGEVYRQRPLCIWPKQAKYKGSGDEKQPENWSCADLY